MAEHQAPIHDSGDYDAEHVPEELRPMPGSPASRFDMSYFRMVTKGIIGGVIVVAIYMVVVLWNGNRDLDAASIIFPAVFIAGWVGILGGVVAVGMWAEKHHGEIYGRRH
jgi:hypothetical protein